MTTILSPTAPQPVTHHAAAVAAAALPPSGERDTAPLASGYTPGSALLEHLERAAMGNLSGSSDDRADLLEQAVRKDESLHLKQLQAILSAQGDSALLQAADEGDDDAAALAALARQLASRQLAPAQLPSALAAGDSHQDFFDEISRLIARLDVEWISKYSGVLAGYAAFFEKLAKAMHFFTDAIKGPEKDGKIKVEFDALRAELLELKSQIESAGFGPVFATQAEALAFLAELDVQGLAVTKRPDGTYQIGVDPALLQSLIDVFPKGTQYLSPEEMSALNANRETWLERFNHINRALPEKYQRQLQMWDMLVKILSSTIDSITEADRAFVQALSG